MTPTRAQQYVAQLAENFYSGNYERIPGLDAYNVLSDGTGMLIIAGTDGEDVDYIRAVSCVTVDAPLTPQLYRAIALDSRRFTLGTFHITEALDQLEPKGLVAVENVIPSALYAGQPTHADLDHLAKSIDSTIKIAAHAMPQYLNDHGGRPYQASDWGALLFASDAPE